MFFVDSPRSDRKHPTGWGKSAASVQLTESDQDQWRSWQLELELPLHCTEDTVECRTMASGRRSVLRTCDTDAPTRTLEIRAAGLGVLKAAS